MSLSQVLAPQLQQSLALLQAPCLELKALVEQEMQQNPILEEVEAAEVEQAEKVSQEGAPANDSADPTEPPRSYRACERYDSSVKNWFTYPPPVLNLGGHPKPASEGHLKTGQS